MILGRNDIDFSVPERPPHIFAVTLTLSFYVRGGGDLYQKVVVFKRHQIVF